MSAPTIVLASASPRRRDLLREHGYNIRISPADTEELIPTFLTPAETTLFNAKRKAEKVAVMFPNEVVLGADTLVALERRVFGKPRDLEDAAAMLSALSGKTHEVYSGVWLVCGRRSYALVEASRVRFRELDSEKIRLYFQRIDPLDKAGAYAAQDKDSEIIESIEGSFTNVVGLPMEALAVALRSFGQTPNR